VQEADTKGLAKTLRLAYAMAEAKYVSASPAPRTGGYSPMDRELVAELRRPSSRDEMLYGSIRGPPQGGNPKSSLRSGLTRAQ
jgi:hypothetical protein